MGKGSGGVMRKPKLPQPETPNQGRDNFQTPLYATELILPFIPNGVRTIWECCAGENEKMARAVFGYLSYKLGDTADVIATDISTNPKYDCLAWMPNVFDCVITNPPYSIKNKVYKRLMSFNKPFALLIPGDWSAWLVKAITPRDEGGDGCRIVLPDRRINYITPSGKSGKKSSSQFHSIWLTRYFNVPDVVHVVHLAKEDLENI